MEVYSKNINNKSCMERLMDKYPCIVDFTPMDIGQHFIFVRYNYIWKGQITKFDTTCNMIWYKNNTKNGLTVYGDEIKVFRIKDIQINNINNLLSKVPIIPDLKLLIIDYLV